MRPKIRTVAAIAGIAALAALVLSVAPALAKSPKKITAVTHTMNHPDTTSVSSDCTKAGEISGGPVWAYDNLSLRLTATPTGSDTYSVTITAHGSFDAVCDPTSGDPYTGHGSVNGWYTLTVTSPTPPDPAAVPSQQQDPLTSQGEIVHQFFPDASSVVGGHYDYVYTQVNGSEYEQVG